jgi:hypothetical protein
MFSVSNTDSVMAGVGCRVEDGLRSEVVLVLCIKARVRRRASSNSLATHSSYTT